MAFPGDIRGITPEDNCTCDQRNADDGLCTKVAMYKLCTESDSMGDEWEHVCEDHIAEIRKSVMVDRSGDCDYCKKETDKLFHRRDPEEGAHGPRYEICKKCNDRCLANDREEFAEMLEQHDDEEFFHGEDDDHQEERDEGFDDITSPDPLDDEPEDKGLDGIR